MGAKIGKPPLSRNWRTLVHLWWHFWRALRQGYTTPKTCGPKFKKGRDIARGAKNRKPPLLKKVKFFTKKIRLTLEKNICAQKDYFSKKKKFWGWGWPLQIFFLKIRFFERTIFSGWQPPLTPKFGDPLIFRLLVDIWTLCANFVEIGWRKVELHVSELPHWSFIIKATMDLVSACELSQNVSF